MKIYQLARWSLIGILLNKGESEASPKCYFTSLSDMVGYIIYCLFVHSILTHTLTSDAFLSPFYFYVYGNSIIITFFQNQPLLHAFRKADDTGKSRLKPYTILYFIIRRSSYAVFSPLLLLYFPSSHLPLEMHFPQTYSSSTLPGWFLVFLSSHLDPSPAPLRILKL